MIRKNSVVALGLSIALALGLSVETAAQDTSDQQSRVAISLKQTKAQHDAVKKLLADLQDPRSASYHKWLTPQEYGRRFGATDQQIERIQKALQARGLELSKVYPNRIFFEVSGTSSSLRQTFLSSVSQANGSKRPVAVVPSELKDVVGSVAIGGKRKPISSIPSNVKYDRKSKTFARSSGSEAKSSSASVGAQSLATIGDFGTPFYGVTPGDMAIQFGLPSYVQGPNTEINGSGSTVGLISDYNVNLNYLGNYGQTFGFYMPQIQVIVDGSDPGVSGGPIATYFEAEAIGAIAPATIINIYTADSDGTEPGVDFSLIRALTDNVVNVLLYPYQGCEAVLSQNDPDDSDTEGEFLNYIFESAAAQGMTIVTPSGDIGSAACDQQFDDAASSGLAVNGVASTPNSTAVGGTDFYYGAQGTATQATYDQYWSNSATDYTGQLGFIPEQAWNDSNQATDQNYGYSYLLATGGGVSTLGLNTENTTAGPGPYPQPWWQLGVVPATISQTARTLPDVSFFAGDYTNNSTYVFCATGADCANNTNQNASNLVFTAGSGTEVSAAVFVGVMALVVGEHGAQGNVNPTLYSMSQHTEGVFNDVIYGTNSVACTAGSNNCLNGFLVDQNGQPGYAALSGYDAATGLGSLNATALVQQWAPPNTSPTTTTIAVLDPNTNQPISHFQHGTPVKITSTVSGSGGTPTGDVAIIDTAAQDASASQDSLTLSDGTATDPNNPLLPGGTYQIFARYAGDATYQPSLSAQTSLVVSSAPCTMVVFLQSPQSGATVTYGTPVSITMEPFDSNNASDVSNATGSINVQDNGANIATVNLNSTGSGIFTSTSLLPKSHSLTFSYNGDPSFQACALASPFNVTVTPSPTATTLTSSLSNVSSTNGAYTLAAVVTPTGSVNQGAFPAGNVTFKRGGTTLASGVALQGFYANGVPSGQAVAYLGAGDLVAGNNTITASYAPFGTTGYAASTSNSVTVNLGNASGVAGSDLVLSTADGGNTYFDYTTSVALNASITGSGTPTGTVALFVNGQFLANMTPSGPGQWNYLLDSRTTSNGLLPVPIGSDTVLAQYSGDAANGPDWANLNLTILDDQVHPDFAITSAADYKFVALGTTTAAVQLRLTPLNGFTGTIYFAPTSRSSITCSVATPGSVTLSTLNSVNINLTCSNIPTTKGRYFIDVETNSAIPSSTPNISTGLAHQLTLSFVVE